MKIRLLAALACAASQLTVAADLQTTVQTSLNYHPALSAAVADKQAAEHDVRAARAGYLPSLSVELSGGQEYADNSSVRAYTDNGNDVRALRGAATLTQLVFDGGATSGRYEAAKGRLVAAESLTDERTQQVVLAAVRAHIEVRKSEELYGLAGDNVERHSRYVNDIERRAKQGVATRTDAVQAQARLALAQASLEDMKKDFLIAKASYREVVGIEAAGLDGATSPQVPFSTLEEAIGQAVQESPSVKEAAAQVSQSRAEFRGARSAAYYPRVDLEIRGSTQDKTANSDFGGVDSQSDTAFAGLVLRYDLYAGGADKARTKQAAQRQSGAESLLLLAKRDAREAVRVAWHEREQLKAKLPRLSSYASSVNQVLSDYEDQFEVNRRRLLDLLDRQVESFRAQSDYTRARHDLILREYELLAAAGQLSAQLK